nr:GNAT family N-acetyltransferase [Paenibacillus nanensis]
MIHPFLKLQWTAQQHSYSHQYPGAEHLILAYDEQKVGQALVARSGSSLSLVDLSMLPAWRNRGLGTLFIQELQAEATAESIPIRLSVLQNNRALRLYERLGFRHKAYNGLHIQMEWSSLPTK